MSTSELATTRRLFLTYFSTVGLSTTLLPGVLWARMQEQGSPAVTAAMLKDALAVAGLEFSDEEREQLLNGVNQNVGRYGNLRQVAIDPAIAPPMYYSPIVPGTRLDRAARPMRTSAPGAVRRPAALEELAFWPIVRLAPLVRTGQVKAVELADLCLARLERHNPTLNCVVTLTRDLAMEQARKADQEMAAGKYRGLLHGIPWGCKDIIAVPGYPTTWGSDAFKTQVIDSEATVVRLLREAGAVLVAKLTTGELAAGDRWFGGRTNSPWDPKEGSSGSSAGPASATAAGLVTFGIGTETSGSILSPATRCGVTGLRPTFGRVSRHGAMTLSWTQDRLGPMCRTAEDCAIVFQAMAKTDEHDLSVIDLPFNWDATIDVRTLRVGYLEAAFGEDGRNDVWAAHDRQALDQLRALGVTLEPFELPKMPLNVLTGILGAESAASFDEFLRSGRDKQLTSPRRGNGFRQSRLIPAVEYLQAQRVRAIIMRQFAGAVSKFDVYLAPSNAPGPGAAAGTGDGTGPGGATATGPGTGAAPPVVSAAATPAGGEEGGRGPSRPSAIRDHFQAANVCGYPAVSVPNGFTADGRPTSITFLGRLYGEANILALVRAYQEAAGWHHRRPALMT